jgi:hypothetical protein
MDQSENLCSLLLSGRLVLKNAHNVALFHNQQVLTVDLDLGAGPFAEQDAVANLHVERDELIVVAARAGTNGYDFALLGFGRTISGGPESRCSWNWYSWAPGSWFSVAAVKVTAVPATCGLGGSATTVKAPRLPGTARKKHRVGRAVKRIHRR